MKKIFYYSIILGLASCCSSKSVYYHAKPPGEEWRLSDKDAAKMIARYNKCGLFRKCSDSGKVVDENDPQLKWINDNYNSVKPVYARYKQRNQKQYANLWGLTPKDCAAKVKGYKTIIIQAENPSQSKGGDNMAAVTYYTLAKLCPPPPNTCLTAGVPLSTLYNKLE